VSAVVLRRARTSVEEETLGYLTVIKGTLATLVSTRIMLGGVLVGSSRVGGTRILLLVLLLPLVKR
jgi:hypothetical protein